MHQQTSSADALGAVPDDRTERSVQNAALDALLDMGVAGPSASSHRLAAAVAGAAANDAGVLLLGEHGTGHALVARAIHLLSRPSSAFLSCSCAGDPGRVERQIFGERLHHTSPSPGRTPSPERITRDSLLFRAKGGTLYLDDVAQLPDGLQARLAHVLRDRDVAIAGDERRDSLDVRLIGSGGVLFDEEVEAGLVRADFAHRLSGARIALVPLRERREDIPAIAGRWLAVASRRAGGSDRALDHPAEVLLSALPWRGNITELRAVVEDLMARSAEPTLDIEALLAVLPLGDQGFSAPVARQRHMTLKAARQEFERNYISAVLAAHHGRIPDAAKALGIQRTNLYRKLRTLRLSLSGGRPMLQDLDGFVRSPRSSRSPARPL